MHCVFCSSQRFRSVSQRIYGCVGKCARDSEKIDIFLISSFSRGIYIAPLFSSSRYLLKRNINITVAVPSSIFTFLLTTFKAGKKRAYELGLMLRESYNSFLGDVYYPPNVYAHSTSVPRCKMTLQLVLAGLYPPVDIQKWNSKLAWQPIDLIYNPPHEDNLLLPMFNST